MQYWDALSVLEKRDAEELLSRAEWAYNQLLYSQLLYHQLLYNQLFYHQQLDGKSTFLSPKPYQSLYKTRP